MKFFKDKLNRKSLFSTIATALLLFFGMTQFTFAQSTSLFGIPTASGFVSIITFAVSYVLSIIFGTIVAIEAWLIGIVLNINANILQTTLVQTGFSISLSIANLAFVLGIIVIAIATILRSNTYGIKQLLWKLVVMAILVNFGLVIMSPIFAIGNSFSQYFLNCINPAGGSCSGTGSSVTSFNNFGTTMAAAFNPNNPFTAPSTVTSSNPAALQGINGAMSVSQNGSDFGQSTVAIFGIVFVAIDLILIVVVLGGFIALLVVRYLYIAILAIVLPLAWASWVFPNFSSHFNKWWSDFIRWTFFAPIVLFFIYLALLTMKQVGSVFDINTYTTGVNGAAANTTWTAISAFLTSAISPVISSFVQEILLAGLIVGGMIAANSMGIKFADTMVSASKKAGNAAKDWTKKRTNQIVGDRLRTAGSRPDGKGGTITSLQRIGSRLQSVPVPGFKALGSKVASTGSAAVLHEEKKEDIKKYVDENLRGLDDKGLITRANSGTALLNPTEAAAIGQELAKRNLLTSTSGLKAGRMKDFLGAAERLGNVQAILNNRPELAAETSAATPKVDAALARMETTIEAADRAIAAATKKIKVADVLDINKKSLGDPTVTTPPTREQRDVALAMSPQQLKKLVTEGSDEQTKAFKDSIEKMVVAATAPGAPPYPPAALANLNKLHAYITTSPEWQAV